MSAKPDFKETGYAHLNRDGNRLVLREGPRKRFITIAALAAVISGRSREAKILKIRTDDE